MFIRIVILCLVYSNRDAAAANLPLVVSTWGHSSFPVANVRAWEYLKNTNAEQGVAALVEGLSSCEVTQCDHTVGYGGSPDENGETTLDALVMDGNNHQMGAVGDLRNVKDAAKVAWGVLNFTEHSFLVGNQATAFATKFMGLSSINLTTNFSIQEHQEWLDAKCQPNFWRNVEPDPRSQCGPYRPNLPYLYETVRPKFDPSNHDTLGMVVIDKNGNVSAGTTTNGARNKLPGRVGDGPIPGAGAFADETGGAAETGDGDVMMRFLPSYLTVEKMRDGCSPTEAAQIAILRIAKSFPTYMGAIVAANSKGDYGAACNWQDTMTNFSYCVASPDMGNTTILTVECIRADITPPTCQKSSSTPTTSNSQTFSTPTTSNSQLCTTKTSSAVSNYNVSCFFIFALFILQGPRRFLPLFVFWHSFR